MVPVIFGKWKLCCARNAHKWLKLLIFWELNSLKYTWSTEICRFSKIETVLNHSTLLEGLPRVPFLRLAAFSPLGLRDLCCGHNLVHGLGEKVKICGRFRPIPPCFLPQYSRHKMQICLPGKKVNCLLFPPSTAAQLGRGEGSLRWKRS